MTRRSATAANGRVAERLGTRVEGLEDTLDAALAESELAEPRDHRRGVRRLHRAEAAVAPTVVRRTQGAAAGVGHRSETGSPVCDRDTDDPSRLALRADAGRGDSRLAAVQERRHDLEQLPLVDRAAVQLEVDPDVSCDRRR